MGAYVWLTNTGLAFRRVVSGLVLGAVMMGCIAGAPSVAVEGESDVAASADSISRSGPELWLGANTVPYSPDAPYYLPVFTRGSSSMTGLGVILRLDEETDASPRRYRIVIGGDGDWWNGQEWGRFDDREWQVAVDGQGIRVPAVALGLNSEFSPSPRYWFPTQGLPVGDYVVSMTANNGYGPERKYVEISAKFSVVEASGGPFAGAQATTEAHRVIQNPALTGAVTLEVRQANRGQGTTTVERWNGTSWQPQMEFETTTGVIQPDGHSSIYRARFLRPGVENNNADEVTYFWIVGEE